MKYTKIDKKKLYESPSLRVHKLRFEAALMGAVSAGGHDQPWVSPSQIQRISKPLIDDTYNEDESVFEQESDIKLY